VNLSLTGKSALVSGSTAGIGFAVATQLAEQGALVYINGRTEERVHRAIEAIREINPAAELAPAPSDLGTREGAEQLFSLVPSVDVLVNNVGGVNAFKPFVDLTDSEWLQAYELNVMSGIRLTRRYLPAMRARNWGRVVFVSSESGVQIPTEFIQYGVAKAALIALARGIAETLPGTGITVNSVLPGPTLSEVIGNIAAASGKSAAEFEKDMIENHRPTSLLRRFTSTEEVANMIAYLCSPASSGTHGASLRVEGGVLKGAF
jgi:NAD(P)-dependent dehydrogenase (short-subunit alcohol dehydrogenase family)